jgi:magnesium-transporting ATPase (P-type)
VQIGHQLVHFFALMLWVAGGLAFLAGLPQLGVAIFIVIVVNALFAFVQEHRADRAAERLRSLLPQRIHVRRDGRAIEVDARDVVVGDVLLLEAGDRIPADAHALAAHGLLIDTSLLTGESEATAAAEGGDLFAGTFVVEGEAEASVDATGPRTRLAGIARLTTATPAPPSLLTAELKRVVRTVAAIAVSVGIAFFVLSVLVGYPASHGFVFGIGVTVALVPEALLPTVTLALAWGAERMSHRGVLVRNLEAVETLGSTTFVCTDKTGTLTRNEMTVVEAWCPEGCALAAAPGYDPAADVVLSDPAAEPALVALAAAAVRCSNGFVHELEGEWRPHGDPMEAALDVFARRLGVDTDEIRTTAVDYRFPFDPRRRRMSIVVDGHVFAKGAPDAILPLCGDAPGASEAVAAFTQRGLRVLAIATRSLGDTVVHGWHDVEADLELCGLVALEDPPRVDVIEAIRACRQAGIKVAMVTGDHAATAAAVAREVGLSGPDSAILSGSDLPADDDVLGALVDRDGIVLARVSPEDKLRIASALRMRGHVVAMTGDGVNDGPALHEADVGIAMGASGTDVAREAADLVLLDDHFATIVAGIEQGRATFLNVRRFLTYHLSDNVAELTPFVVWALSGGRFPLALGVLQILALDIGTDTLSAVALGAEPPPATVLERGPVSGRLLNRTVLRRAFGVLGPAEALMSMCAFLATFVVTGWGPGDPFPEGGTLLAASGAAFVAVVLGQSANAFACRSSVHWPGSLGWTTNRLLIPAVLVGLGVSLAFVYVGPLARELGQSGPTPTGWLVALTAPVVVLAADLVSKRRSYGPQRARRGVSTWA